MAVEAINAFVFDSPSLLINSRCTPLRIGVHSCGWAVGARGVCAGGDKGFSSALVDTSQDTAVADHSGIKRE